jgi:ubiquitin-activating enzyme E1
MVIIHRYTNHARSDHRSIFELNLGDNDYVIFKEVGGIPQLNDGRPRKIKIISSDTFQILGDDFSKYPEYTSGGIVNQVKIPKKCVIKL